MWSSYLQLEVPQGYVQFLAQVGGDMVMLEDYVDMADQLFHWKAEHAKSSKRGM